MKFFRPKRATSALSEAFTLRSAKRIGTEHVRLSHNCQDASKIAATDEYVIGVVCDGVSQTITDTSRSEVGAHLLSQFIASRLLLLKQAGVSNHEALRSVFEQCLTYLRTIVSFAKTERERTKFIAENLLTTVVGFVSDHKETTVFWYGDGFVSLNDEILLDDNTAAPHCVAYLLLDKKYRHKQTKLPRHFTTKRIRTTSVHRLAIASDGLAQTIAQAPQLIDGLWGHTSKMSLQFWLNRTAREPHYCTDDTTIIVFERKPTDQKPGATS